MSFRNNPQWRLQFALVLLIAWCGALHSAQMPNVVFILADDMGYGDVGYYTKPLLGGPADRGFDTFFGMHASLDIPPYFYIRDRLPASAPTGDAPANDSKGTPDEWNGIQGAFWRAGKVAPDFKFDEVTPRFVEEEEGVPER